MAIMTPALVLGLVRIGLGQERERPVGYLEILVAVLAIATLLIAHVRRFGTLRGEEALLRLSKTNARALRAPLPEELLLTFAVSGPAALAGSGLPTGPPSPTGQEVAAAAVEVVMVPGAAEAAAVVTEGSKRQAPVHPPFAASCARSWTAAASALLTIDGGRQQVIQDPLGPVSACF